ncbi:MAG: PHP domain-containing protein [Microbacterium sp.]
MGSGRMAQAADLHLHSAMSDGTEQPAEMVASAFASGVRTLALTDHDTTDGWSAAAEAARERGMTFLPGVELSTRIPGRSIHLLAYLLDPTHEGLNVEMDRVRDDRVGRAERIVGNLSRDYDLGWEDVLEQTSDGATIGRPHIADALVSRGIVPSRDAAFAGILHPRAGYYVGHYATDVFEAIRLVLDAGGVPIVAHAMTEGRSGQMPEATLYDLADAGVAGFEVDHRENPPAGREVLRCVVADRGLIATGSSDYHGTGKPNRPGENTTPLAEVERIIALGTGSAPVFP